MNDLRYAFRTLLKTPGFTLVIILTLALGIGANTALFSIINQTLLRPLPYAQSDELLAVQSVTRNNARISPSYPDFLDLKAAQRCFERFTGAYIIPANLVGPASTDRVSTAFVDGDFFALLRVSPALGRGFTPADDQPSAASVALVTHAAWQSRFGGAADLIGRQVQLAGRSVTIAGILPQTFRYHRPAEFFTPLKPFVQEFFMDARSSHYGDFEVLARRRSDVSLPAAQAEMDAAAARLEREYPKTNPGTGVLLTPLQTRLGGGSRDTLYLLLGAVGMVLLIACVNVANMMLARACSRQKEMAVRVALGADRARVIRQLLTESLLLSCSGGLVGVVLAQWIQSALGLLVPYSLRVLGEGGSPATLDGRVILFSVAVSVLTGLAFGLAPSWLLSHTSPQDALKERTASGTKHAGRFRLSDLLVVTEVALAAMLLIGAGLLLRSLWQLKGQALGFEPERLITLKIATPFNRLNGDWVRTQSFYEEASAAVQQLPGVESAAIVNNLSFSYANSNIMFYVRDRPIPAPGEFPTVLNKSVDPDYFRTMGIPVIAGRIFERTDRRPAFAAGKPDLDVVLAAYRDFVIDGVVTRSFAQRYWPGENAVGKVFRLGTPETPYGWVQITAVVGDSSQYALDQTNREEIYLNFRQWMPPLDFGLVIRAKGDPKALISSIRTQLQQVAKDEPVYDVRLQTDLIDSTIRGRRFNSQLFVFFASVALGLSLVGIYGVIAFSVSRQTREIGIRMALGAQQGQVLREVVFRGICLFVPGITVGLVAAWLLSRLIQNQLYGIAPTDAWTYAGAALSLFAAAALACLVPAHRASRIDPIEALRSE